MIQYYGLNQCCYEFQIVTMFSVMHYLEIHIFIYFSVAHTCISNSSQAHRNHNSDTTLILDQ
jgi:hypothetical protein